MTKYLKELYNFTIKASVRSDMAKRIMYSTLSSVVTPGQIAGTNNVIDFKALDAACEGADDILKYGIQACLAECYYYDQNGYLFLGEYETDKINPKEIINENSYSEILKECNHLFNDKSNWAEGFGGYAWLKISESLTRINLLNENLKQQKSLKSKDLDKIVNIQKQLVMELNIFDGLSHNNGSVMKNIIRIESSEKNRKDLSEEEKVTRLMDAKELNDPKQVFDEIKNTLKESGDYHRFNDYNYKFNKQIDDSEYDKRLDQLNVIRFRKAINSNAGYLIRDRDKLINDLKQIDKSYNYIANDNYKRKAEYLFLNVKNSYMRLSEIAVQLSMIKQYQEMFSGAANTSIVNINSLAGKMLSKLNNIKNNAYESLKPFSYDTDFNHIDKKDADVLIIFYPLLKEEIEEFLKELNMFIFVLQDF